MSTYNKSDNLSIRSLEGFVKNASFVQRMQKKILSENELLALLKNIKDTADNNVSNKGNENHSSAWGTTYNVISAIHSTVSTINIITGWISGRKTEPPQPPAAK
jgi:hypothetical protein